MWTMYFFYFDSLLIHCTAAAGCSEHLCNKEKNNLEQNMQKEARLKEADSCWLACVGFHNSVQVSCLGDSYLLSNP